MRNKKVRRMLGGLLCFAVLIGQTAVVSATESTVETSTSGYVCKIGETGYETITDAISAVSDETATAESDGSYLIEMLVSSYTMPATATKLPEEKDVIITTAGSDGSYPYEGASGTVATLEKGSSTEDMFYLTTGSLTLTDITIDNSNTSAMAGMAINVQGSGTLILEEGATIQNWNTYSSEDRNRSTVYVEAGAEVILKDGSLIQNCTSYYGGAIFLNSPATPGTITMEEGSEIKNCQAYAGGAIHIGLGGEATTSYITVNGKISDCISEINGGAIDMNQYNAPNLMLGSTCEITNCSAGTFGGAVSLRGMSVVTLEDGMTISDCTAVTYGGGIASVSAATTINGGSIVGCTAGTYGGGFALEEESELTINGGTISGCTAGTYGGGIYAAANVSFMSETQNQAEVPILIQNNYLSSDEETVALTATTQEETTENNLFETSAEQIILRGELASGSQIGVSTVETEMETYNKIGAQFGGESTTGLDLSAFYCDLDGTLTAVYEAASLYWDYVVTVEDEDGNEIENVTITDADGNEAELSPVDPEVVVIGGYLDENGNIVVPNDANGNAPIRVAITVEDTDGDGVIDLITIQATYPLVDIVVVDENVNELGNVTITDADGNEAELTPMDPEVVVIGGYLDVEDNSDGEGGNIIVPNDENGNAPIRVDITVEDTDGDGVIDMITIVATYPLTDTIIVDEENNEIEDTTIVDADGNAAELTPLDPDAEVIGGYLDENGNIVVPDDANGNAPIHVDVIVEDTDGDGVIDKVTIVATYPEEESLVQTTTTTTVVTKTVTSTDKTAVQTGDMANGFFLYLLLGASMLAVVIAYRRKADA